MKSFQTLLVVVAVCLSVLGVFTLVNYAQPEEHTVQGAAMQDLGDIASVDPVSVPELEEIVVTPMPEIRYVYIYKNRNTTKIIKTRTQNNSWNAYWEMRTNIKTDNSINDSFNVDDRDCYDDKDVTDIDDQDGIDIDDVEVDVEVNEDNDGVDIDDVEVDVEINEDNDGVDIDDVEVDVEVEIED